MSRLLALVFLAAVSLPLPAHATDGSDYAGGCVWEDSQHLSVSGSYSGVAYAAVALYATSPDANPVSATVSCSVRLDGTDVAAHSESGTAAVVFARRLAFEPGGEVRTAELCTRVDYADATPTAEHCAPLWLEVLPPGLFDTIDPPMTEEWVDPVLCPPLAGLHPFVPGVSWDGDVSVAGEPVWDCPPYDWGG